MDVEQLILISISSILIPLLLGLAAIWYKLGKVESGILHLITRFGRHLDDHRQGTLPRPPEDA